MAKLELPAKLSSAFGEYEIREILGEGGAGRVYGGFDDAGSPLAIKVLTNPSTDQRKRFKNEIRFLSLNKHRNIVEVTDSGLCQAGPFYVMHRFDSSVRPLIGKLEPVEVLSLYSEVLDGVEAAHFQDVVHRDLKPENILYDSRKRRPAIADFGVARFGMDMLSTLVETSPGQRLANFQYAAPEQRMRGGQVTVRADVYALGLILNELYTGAVPHGTKYKTISDVAPEFGFLDNIVARMLRQNPAERPVSITEVKQLIQRYRAEAVTLQKLSKLRDAVIPQYEIDEPLAHNPPIVVGAGWTNGILTLTLDRPVTSEWVQALRQMGSYYSVLGAEPERFTFDGRTARVATAAGSAQMVIDYFKSWLPTASNKLHQLLKVAAVESEQRQLAMLKKERETEELNLKTNNNLHV